MLIPPEREVEEMRILASLGQLFEVGKHPLGFLGGDAGALHRDGGLCGYSCSGHQ